MFFLGLIVIVAIWSKGTFFLSPEKLTAIQGKSEFPVQTGDLVFHTSTSTQSEPIQLATKSKYSHVGIVFEMTGRFWVFEAVQPVGSIPLRDWIKRGKDRQYVIMRLKDAETKMDKAAKIRLQLEAEKHVGKDYDLLFSWSDEKMYCSELVWKMYRDALGLKIGKPELLGDFDLSHPKVQSILTKRYGDQVPLNDTIISPAAILASDLLEEIPVN